MYLGVGREGDAGLRQVKLNIVVWPAPGDTVRHIVLDGK